MEIDINSADWILTSLSTSLSESSSSEDEPSLDDSAFLACETLDHEDKDMWYTL